MKKWMDVVKESNDSFDSEHSAENLVNYYDEENPDFGDPIDLEFSNKLAIGGTINTVDEDHCVIDIDSTAMGMLEDLNVIDTTEGYEILPKMDRDKYQERDGLEGPIMTRSGKVLYYDPKAGNYLDPDKDMYITYNQWKEYDSPRKAESKEDEDTKEKLKALDDIKKDPHTANDPELKKELMKRTAELKAKLGEAEEKPYICVHADKGKHECHATSSYGAAKKAAEHWGMKSTAGIDAHLAVDEDFDKDHPDFPKAQAFKSEKEQVMDIMKKYPEEAKKLKDGSFDFYGSDLYNELMDYYADEMPYGVMKARDGDPMEWLDSKLDDLGLLDEGVYEAKYQGKTVKLNKPIRTGKDEPKKFKVYVKDGDKVKLVRFGHQGKGNEKTMKIKKSDPARRKSFRARHNCSNPGPKTKARYWSCRAW